MQAQEQTASSLAEETTAEETKEERTAQEQAEGGDGLKEAMAGPAEERDGICREKSKSEDKVGKERTAERADPAQDPPATLAESKEEGDGRAADFAKLIEQDTEALRRAVPACKELGSILELEHAPRYAALRELGLTPVEAYYATCPRGAEASAYDNRSHLHPSVGKVAAGGGGMTAAELHAARELFAGLSDAALQSLYRRATGTARS